MLILNSVKLALVLIAAKEIAAGDTNAHSAACIIPGVCSDLSATQSIHWLRGIHLVFLKNCQDVLVSRMLFKIEACEGLLDASSNHSLYQLRLNHVLAH